MRLSGHIDSGVASQIAFVLALEILVARIDVPAFSIFVRLDIIVLVLLFAPDVFPPFYLATTAVQIGQFEIAVLLTLNPVLQ